jgi:hypothetical protein
MWQQIEISSYQLEEIAMQLRPFADDEETIVNQDRRLPLLILFKRIGNNRALAFAPGTFEYLVENNDYFVPFTPLLHPINKPQVVEADEGYNYLFGNHKYYKEMFGDGTGRRNG